MPVKIKLRTGSERDSEKHLLSPVYGPTSDQKSQRFTRCGLHMHFSSTNHNQCSSVNVYSSPNEQLISSAQRDVSLPVRFSLVCFTSPISSTSRHPFLNLLLFREVVACPLTPPNCSTRPKNQWKIQSIRASKRSIIILTFSVAV